MKIETIKDMSALLDLCRKKGVESIEVDGLKITLGSAPTRKAKNAGPDTIVAPDALTDEQAMFWSAGGQLNG